MSDRGISDRGLAVVCGWVLAIVVLLTPLLVDPSEIDGYVFAIASSVVSLEIIDIGLRIWFGRDATRRGPARRGPAPRPAGAAKRLQPYALVLSVRNVQGESDLLLGRLAPFKTRTWFVDDASCDQTVLQLRSQGWRCIGLDSNRKKPAALKALLAYLPGDIETVIVLDPDAVPLLIFADDDLESAVRRFQQSGAAACCPRVRFDDGGGLAAMQLVECEMAFGLGRRGMSPDCVTSGVAMYERRALEGALAEHSLSVYAEDLENSLILIGRGAQVYYDDGLIIASSGKDRIADWFSQRVGWSYGLLRAYAQRSTDVITAARRSPWAFYNFAVYLGVFAILMAPIKLLGVALLAISFANGLDALLALNLIPDNSLTSPHYFAASYVASTVLVVSLIAYLQPKARLHSLATVGCFYFFYAALHVVPMCVGYLNFISLRLVGRRIYRDHYAANIDPREALS